MGEVVTVSVLMDNTPPTATITGVPVSPTNLTGATLNIGEDQVTHYKYRVDDGSYNSEISSDVDIVLAELSDGSHSVYVLGRDTAGNWESLRAS